MVNLPIEYSDKQVTPFGGMSLMKRFIDQIGIRDYLRSIDLPYPGSNRGYSTVQIVDHFGLGYGQEHRDIFISIGLDMIKCCNLFLGGNKCHHKAPIVVFLVSFHKSVTPKYFQIYSIGFSTS